MGAVSSALGLLLTARHQPWSVWEMSLQESFMERSTHSTAVTCIPFQPQMSTAAAHSVASG